MGYTHRIEVFHPHYVQEGVPLIIVRFLGGLVIAWTQWIWGLIAMIPTFFILGFDDSGQAIEQPRLILMIFLVLGCVIVWLIGRLIRAVAKCAYNSVPFAWGQVVVGILLCVWGFGASILWGEGSVVYPLFVFLMPGLLIFLPGVHTLVINE